MVKILLAAALLELATAVVPSLKSAELLSKNLITEKQLFDFLLLYCENPNLDIDEIIEIIHQQKENRYEILLSNVKNTISTQSGILQ